MRNGKSNLSHTILYAKGWYNKGTEIWKDLVETISHDNRTINENKHEVAMFLRRYISNNHEFFKKNSLNCLTIDWFITEVEKMCHYTNMDEDDATIAVCLSILYNLESDSWVVVEPNPYVLATDNERIDRMAYLMERLNIN